MLYKELTFAPGALHSELQQQTIWNTVNTQKSPPWACDKGCAEACAERFSALNIKMLFGCFRSAPLITICWGFAGVIESMLIAELWRVKRACGAPWVSKSTHPRKFGNHVTVHRPPARPSAPQGNQCSISHFLASLGAQEDWYCTHIAHQCCDQLTAVNRAPLTSITWPYHGFRCRAIEVEYFSKLSTDKLLVFKWLQTHV